MAQQNFAVSDVYHLAAAGETFWDGYASFVIDFARQAGGEIKISQEAIWPVPSRAFVYKVKEPIYSRFNTV